MRAFGRGGLRVLDLLAAIGLVVEDDVATAAPNVRADGGEGHGWGDELGLLS